MTYRLIYTRPDGGVSIVVPAAGVPQDVAARAVPGGVAFDAVDVADIPAERAFRNAWQKVGQGIGTDLVKAKTIAQDKRRTLRDRAFEPLDRKATIPSEAQQAEVARQKIRTKDAQVQTQIDDATDESALLAIFKSISFGVA